MLNDQQLLFVQNLLNETPINHVKVKEELLDHLCCDIEFQMHKGMAFHEACQATFNTFREDEMQEIEQHFFNLNHHKQLIMKKVSVLALSLMFLATAIWALNEEPPSRIPLDEGYKITSGFGQRIHPIYGQSKMHKGIDFKADLGTPIYATSNGMVSEIERKETGYGNKIVIKHDETFHSVYGQLSAIKVVKGQKLKKGDLIGLVGASGAATGPHLHYEVWKNGKAVNPEPYLKP